MSISNCRDRNYLLLTPLRDEAAHLGNVIRHVSGQSIRPVIWILVDDHSRDSSGEICARAARRYPWIRALSYEGPARKRQLGVHVYEVLRRGYEYGVKFCREEGVDYRYVAFLDADMFPVKDYFERLVGIMERNREMGIVSGGVYVRDGDGNLVWEKSPLQWPWGGARLLRRDCFEMVGGIHPVHSSDAVSAIRALKLGYKIRQFKEIQVVQSRQTSSAKGLPAGYYKRGSDDYYLGYSLPYALAKGINKAWDISLLLGLCYLSGYVSSLSRRGKRIGDPVVREFCRGRLLRRFLSRDFPAHSEQSTWRAIP